MQSTSYNVRRNCRIPYQIRKGKKYLKIVPTRIRKRIDFSIEENDTDTVIMFLNVNSFGIDHTRVNMLTSMPQLNTLELESKMVNGCLNGR